MVWQSNLWIGAYTVLVGASFSVRRIDCNGWIELSTDGVSTWVEAERK